VRSIWGWSAPGLRLYHAQIAAVEGRADASTPTAVVDQFVVVRLQPRDQFGARTGAAVQIRAGLSSGCAGCSRSVIALCQVFRSTTKLRSDDLFTQVLGMLSAEGLITLERGPRWMEQD